MRQDARDSLADGGEGGGAEGAVAAVQELDALGFEVHEEADFDAPVEKGTRADEGVGHAAGRGGFLLQGVLDLDFVREDGEAADFVVEGVGAEFGGDEAFDVRFGRGFDEEKLGGEGGEAEGRDEGFLA